MLAFSRMAAKPPRKPDHCAGGVLGSLSTCGSARESSSCPLASISAVKSSMDGGIGARDPARSQDIARRVQGVWSLELRALGTGPGVGMGQVGGM